MSDIRNNTDRHRFELEVDGHTAFADYELTPGQITLTHTEVPEALAGRGIATRLIQGALMAIRNEGRKVVAKCPFVSGYVRKHPEFNDLLA